MKVYLAAWAVYLGAVFVGVDLPFLIFVGLISWGAFKGLRAISGGEFYTTR